MTRGPMTRGHHLWRRTLAVGALLMLLTATGCRQELRQVLDSQTEEPAPARIAAEEVQTLLARAHQHPYTLQVRVGDRGLVQGVRPNGDRFVSVGTQGFLHVGLRSWLLSGDEVEEGPFAGAASAQMPFLAMLEGAHPDDLGVLGLIADLQPHLTRGSAAGLQEWRLKEGAAASVPWHRLHPLATALLDPDGAAPAAETPVAVQSFRLTFQHAPAGLLPGEFTATFAFGGEQVALAGAYSWADPAFPAVAPAFDPPDQQLGLNHLWLGMDADDVLYLEDRFSQPVTDPGGSRWLSARSGTEAIRLSAEGRILAIRSLSGTLPNGLVIGQSDRRQVELALGKPARETGPVLEYRYPGVGRLLITMDAGKLQAVEVRQD
jgi:hypothetical protein